MFHSSLLPSHLLVRIALVPSFFILKLLQFINSVYTKSQRIEIFPKNTCNLFPINQIIMVNFDPEINPEKKFGKRCLFIKKK